VLKGQACRHSEDELEHSVAEHQSSPFPLLDPKPVDLRMTRLKPK